MALNPALLNQMLVSNINDSWNAIVDHVWDTFSAPVGASDPAGTVVQRDRDIADLDLVLASSCWDMWHGFVQAVPRASCGLVDFWQSVTGGKAVLILDALSVRECPCIIENATSRGYKLLESSIRGSELPGDTTEFAKSLGFSQRSSLENNGAGGAHKLNGAFTDCVNLPWEQCESLVGHHSSVVIWHYWLDDKLHELSAPGKGLHNLAKAARDAFSSDEFWRLIESLTQGRELVITGDHGYAASGLFQDAGDKDQSDFLKDVFRSGRSTSDTMQQGSWMPPVSLVVSSVHGDYQYVLGRRKWKSAGGYPTLTHGGLSLLEVLVPFIRLTRNS